MVLAQSAKEIAPLKREMHAWLKKHQLTHDAGWRGVDEYDQESLHPVYLVLWCEGD